MKQDYVFSKARITSVLFLALCVSVLMPVAAKAQTDGTGGNCAAGWQSFLSNFYDINSWEIPSDSLVEVRTAHLPNPKKVDKRKFKEDIYLENNLGYYKGNVKNTRRAISDDYVRRYVLRPYEQDEARLTVSVCGKSVPRYNYYYSGKARMHNGDWVCFVYREDSTCVQPLGHGVVEVFLQAYSPDGDIKARSLVLVDRYGGSSQLGFSEQYYYYRDMSSDMRDYDGEIMKYMFTDSVAFKKREVLWKELRLRCGVYDLLFDNRADSSYVTPIQLYVRVRDNYSMELVSAYMYFYGKARPGGAREDNRVQFERHVDGVDLRELDAVYHQLAAHPSDSALLRRFFDVFPSTWDGLVGTYQYRIDKNFDPHMFCETEAQINTFIDTRKVVSKREFMRKVIRLWLGGSNTNAELLLYHNMSWSVVWALKDEPALFLEEMQALTFRDQMEFWRHILLNDFDEECLKTMDGLRAGYSRRYGRVFKVFDMAVEIYNNMSQKFPGDF